MAKLILPKDVDIQEDGVYVIRFSKKGNDCSIIRHNIVSQEELDKEEAERKKAEAEMNRPVSPFNNGEVMEDFGKFREVKLKEAAVEQTIDNKEQK